MLPRCTDIILQSDMIAVIPRLDDDVFASKASEWCEHMWLCSKYLFWLFRSNLWGPIRFGFCASAFFICPGGYVEEGTRNASWECGRGGGEEIGGGEGCRCNGHPVQSLVLTATGNHRRLGNVALSIRYVWLFLSSHHCTGGNAGCWVNIKEGQEDWGKKEEEKDYILLRPPFISSLS